MTYYVLQSKQGFYYNIMFVVIIWWTNKKYLFIISESKYSVRIDNTIHEILEYKYYIGV